MKKVFVLFLCFFLVACSTSTTDYLIYQNAIDVFNYRNNYTVRIIENGMVSDFVYSGDYVKANDDNGKYYIYKEEDKCFILAYDDEYGIYIKQEIEDDDHYFFAYELIERLKKLAAYVNQNDLKYDDSKKRFSGSSFEGAYVYKGVLHQPLDIEIEVKDGRISSYKEKYLVDGKEFFDEIFISNYGNSLVDLPLNVVDVLEEMEK